MAGRKGGGEETARRKKRLAFSPSDPALFHELLVAQNEMGIGVAITEGTRILLVNEALAKMYGYTVEEMTALPSTLDAVPPEYREEFAARRPSSKR